MWDECYYFWDECYCFLDVAAVIWTQQEQHPTEKGAEAAAKVLAIPELLGHILLHVRNRDELASAKKVSQLWKAEAERVEPRIPKKQPVHHICHSDCYGQIYVFAMQPMHGTARRHCFWVELPGLPDPKQEHRLEIEKQVKKKHKRHCHPPPARQSRRQQNPRVKYPYPRSRPRKGGR